MDMIRVSSSAIAAIGYDPTTMRMKIRFVQGDTYDFCGVPAHVFNGLLNARSKGSYYNNHIRHRYQC
ncbi:MAG: KTSC domain-containing protein [Porticoccaceae bacterium]